MGVILFGVYLFNFCCVWCCFGDLCLYLIVGYFNCSCFELLG